MKYNQFIELVQRRAHLSSESEAQRAAQATLETLAAYISPKERHEAASQLPKVIKEYMQQPFLAASIAIYREQRWGQTGG